MEIIGEKLRASREEKSLSLEEVSEDLKIPVKDLENIEKGDKKAFSDIYLLKKYIYDYAKYLGLDYESLIDEFNEYMFEYTSKIPTDVIERISKQKEKEEEKERVSPYTIVKPKNNKKKIIIIVLCALVVLGTIIFFVTNNRRPKSAELAFTETI